MIHSRLPVAWMVPVFLLLQGCGGDGEDPGSEVGRTKGAGAVAGTGADPEDLAPQEEGPVYWPLPETGPGHAWFLLDHLQELEVASPLLEDDRFQLTTQVGELNLLAGGRTWSPPGEEETQTVQFRELPIPAWFGSAGTTQPLDITDPAGNKTTVWLIPAVRHYLLSEHLEATEPPMPTRRDATGTRNVLVEQDRDLAVTVDLLGQAAKATLRVAKGPGPKDAWPDGVDDAPTVEVLLEDEVIAGPLEAPEGKVNYETSFDLPPGDLVRLVLRTRGTHPGFGSTTVQLKSLKVVLEGRRDLLVTPQGLDPACDLTYLVETGDGIQMLRGYDQELVLGGGTVHVHAKQAQPFQVQWNGAVVASSKIPVQDLAFDRQLLAPGRLEVVVPGSQPRGPFWVVQPRLMLRRLTASEHGEEGESPIKKDADLMRGAESKPGEQPRRDRMVRHRMVADESRRCLLATPGTRIVAPWEARSGDRVELSLSARDLSSEDVPRASTKVQVRWREAVEGQEDVVTTLMDELVVVGLKSWTDYSLPLPEGAGAGRLEVEVLGSPATPPGVATRLCPLLAEPRIVRSAGTGPRPPNVVVYLIDTLRADHVSAYGYERNTTPAIDQLAREGVLFERAYSQAPWTRPSVATLFSGFYYSFHNAGKVTGLAPGLNTLGECMRAAGFDTGAFIANAHVHGESLNFEQGFSEFVGVERKRGDSRADDVNEVVFPWLDRHQDRPFFLYVHTIDPHATYDPPEATAGTFNKGYDGPLTPKDTHAGSFEDDLTDDDVQYLLDLYDEEILFNDQQFARLVQKLKDLGLYDDTLILVTSDHGEEFREHGEFGHGRRLWEELIHVPFILKPPASASVPAGQRIQETVGLVDVLGTTCSFAGITLPGDTQGMDLRPWTLGSLPGESRILLSEEEADDTFAHRALIRGNVKLIEWYVHLKDVDGIDPTARRRYRLELYDLGKDPGEQEDLALEDPQQAQRVLQLMERFRGDLSDRFPSFLGLREHLSAADLAALKALGYVN